MDAYTRTGIVAGLRRIKQILTSLAAAEVDSQAQAKIMLLLRPALASEKNFELR